MSERLWRAAPSLAALLAAILVSGAVVMLAGGSPERAFAALIDGAFGSADSLSETLVKTCPLLLCGLAIAISFQTGVWNIGAEGQLIMGALLAAWLGGRFDWPGVFGLPITLACAAASGAAWAGIAGGLRVRREVNEVISTIMLNFIAIGLIGFLVQGPLMEAGGRYPQTDALPDVFRLPRLAPPLRVHAGLLIAVLAVLGLHVTMYGTVLGYEMRVVGLSPEAARVAGIDVDRRLFWAMVISGGLAGLAGGIEVSGVTFRLYERFSPGYGFTAIAVGLLGRLTPFGVMVAALLFGALEAGSNAMQREAGVSSVLVAIIQATVILFLVAAEHGRWLPRRAPVSQE